MKILNLIKKYGKQTVVEEVSVTIPKGQVTSFIGPNGAGKSTVLGMITRLIARDNGEVMLDGQALEAYKSNDLAKKLAILKQSNHHHLKLTIRELVSFGRFPHSAGRLTPEDEKQIDEAIHYMELTDIEHKYLDELSGGQRQRAYIAMVIAQDTEYVLLDEPLNNLDMHHSVKMMQVIRKLAHELGKTVIIVMHDINFASCYSDYIVAFKKGRVAAAGKTEEIIKKQVLEEIYEMNFDIHSLNGQNICVYY
ncbi:iron ABC transporter ATP-binding protein [Niameybacter massiliensis]|uniref:iron ABC transporter ATP-binding protein n=1 Tax=Niameybacter massiliensis TaxID=1658108 RepID=UPI0006B6610D|nr:ATP-binding cassette domain-containing protein [Niameybacter massiliensis]